MASRSFPLAAALLAGVLTALAAKPVSGLEPEPAQTVRSAHAAAPIFFESGTALTFTVQRSAPPLAGADCEAVANAATPGAEIVMSDGAAAFSGIIVVAGDGFDRLIFEDPSGRVTCLAGSGGAPQGGDPVGGFQTLLNRPFGPWRFWVTASQPGPFEVRIEYE